MRCGLSPIVAMRKTRGLFIVGNKKGFAIYWEFTVFFRSSRESEPFCREFEAFSPSLPQPPNTHYPQYEVLGSCGNNLSSSGNNLSSSGNKLTVPPETSSVHPVHPRFFYFTFYRLMITFVGCFGIEIKQICLHLNC